MINKKKRVVVALGGNALGNTVEEQLVAVKKTAYTIVDLVKSGYDVVVGHGNGPQVGAINLAMEVSANSGAGTPDMPLAECGAMSQGYIGYHLQQAIKKQLSIHEIDKNVVSLITQVIVDKEDPAFVCPTKPIGNFYVKEQAERIEREKSFTFMEDAGRGYRRVVPSPAPCEIVELDVINHLVSKGDIVITVGGGGIPVLKDEHQLVGVSAVIDKDKSCAKLARDLNADVLLILTAVDGVYVNYKKENQRKLSKITDQEVQLLCKQGQFAKGSMLPKMEACLEFIKDNTQVLAIVTSLEKAKEALEKTAGTIIYKSENL